MPQSQYTYCIMMVKFRDFLYKKSIRERFFPDSDAYLIL